MSMLRTPRHEYGPTAATPSSYATPRGPALGSSVNANAHNALTATPGGPSSSSFDFLQHPLFADPESLQGGLQFDGLYAKMAGFKENLDNYVEESCARLEEARMEQGRVKEEREALIRGREKEVEAEKKAQHDLYAAIATERSEDAEARRIQSEKERYAHSLSSQLSDIQSELDALRQQFALRREEKQRIATKLRSMARLNVPERELLESRTGCRIGSPGEDLISFTFTHLSAERPAEEAYFVFAIQRRTYSMPVVEPALGAGVVEGLLEELNRSRNAFKCIKEMRRLLKGEVERGRRVARGLDEAVRDLRV